MDLIQTAGKLGLGSRMRRISEMIMRQGSEIYQLYGLDFDPANFPVYYALSQTDRAGIMELADQLGLTHPAVIRQARDLGKVGLVQSEQDRHDRRRRWLSLSGKGKQALPQLKVVWEDIQTAMEDLVAGDRPFMEELDRMEHKLRGDGLVQAVDAARRKRLGSSVVITPFTTDRTDEYRALNYNWIEEHFSLEEADRRLLEDPQGQIIDPGGAILLAQLGERIIGGVALLLKEDGVFELAKMAVEERYQRYGIGKRLAQEAIRKVRQLGGRRIVLETHPKLQAAIRLYRRLGFREVSRTGTQPSEYQRSEIRMEMYV